MSDPNTIREAVYGDVPMGPKVLAIIGSAALAYADSLDDPIWWCFKHDSVKLGRALCATALARNPNEYAPCDIALATRPRRIE